MPPRNVHRVIRKDGQPLRTLVKYKKGEENQYTYIKTDDELKAPKRCNKGSARTLAPGAKRITCKKRVYDSSAEGKARKRADAKARRREEPAF